MRGDKSFAYDLDISLGAVNSRVALLLRSIEAKPQRVRFVFYTPHLVASVEVLEGERGGAELPLVDAVSQGSRGVKRRTWRKKKPGRES